MEFWEGRGLCLDCFTAPFPQLDSNIHRKPEAVFYFPMNAKVRNISKPAWTNAVTCLPLWFHVTHSIEMKPRQYYKTLQEASPRNQESLTPKLQASWSQGWALQLYEASHTSMHPRITHSHEPNERTSPVGRRSRPQRVDETTVCESFPHRVFLRQSETARAIGSHQVM